MQPVKHTRTRLGCLEHRIELMHSMVPSMTLSDSASDQQAASRRKCTHDHRARNRRLTDVPIVDRAGRALRAGTLRAPEIRTMDTAETPCAHPSPGWMYRGLHRYSRLLPLTAALVVYRALAIGGCGCGWWSEWRACRELSSVRDCEALSRRCAAA